MRLETIKIGRIVNAHGIRGEVRVQPRDLDPHLLTRFDTFLLDGQPVKLISGALHYFRIVPEYWQDRLEKLKNMG